MTWLELADMAIPPLTTLVGLGLLVYYRSNRKFKRDKFKGFLEFLDSNIVELIFGAAIVPNFISTIVKMME